MLRLPRMLLDPKTAEQYCVEDAEDSLSAIVRVRSELTAGDLRPLYLA